TVGVLLVVAAVLYRPLRIYSLTAFEVIVVALGLLWMTTLVRVLAVLTPDAPRASGRGRQLGCGAGCVSAVLRAARCAHASLRFAETPRSRRHPTFSASAAWGLGGKVGSRRAQAGVGGGAARV